MTTSTKIRLGVTIALIAMVITIILQNTETVFIQILFASIQMPLAFLLFTTFLIGMLIGCIVAYFQINRRLATAKQKK